MEDWRVGDGLREDFGSDQKRKEFESVIRKTGILPEWFVDLIMENLSRGAITEMYPMVIDREAAKRYDEEKFDRDNKRFQKIFGSVNSGVDPEMLDWIKSSIKTDRHFTGRMLVFILEEQFPDFIERKKFIRLVLGK